MKMIDLNKKLDRKTRIILVAIILFIGIIIGFLIDFPNKFEIKFEVVNETREWWELQTEELYNITNLWENRTNMCCFPTECSQAKNNPDQCTCLYLVECFNEDG